METTIAVPIFGLAKVPVAPVVIRLTPSPPKTPDREAPPVLRVATVVPSYALLLAVTPVMVRLAVVILAVDVGCVRV